MRFRVIAGTCYKWSFRRRHLTLVWSPVGLVASACLFLSFFAFVSLLIRIPIKLSSYPRHDPISDDTTILVEQKQLSSVTTKESESTAYVDENWKQSRKMLLVNKTRPTKVLLFAYMRGGSTVFGELFNIGNNSNVYWYEPMDAFYSYYYGLRFYNLPLSLLYDGYFKRRIPTNHEREELTRYLDHLLSCDIDRLPFETLAHTDFISRASAFKDTLKCLPYNETVREEQIRCNDKLRPFCVNSKEYRKYHRLIPYMTRTCHKIVRALRVRIISKTNFRSKPQFPDQKQLANILSSHLTDKEYYELYSHFLCMNQKHVNAMGCVAPVTRAACSGASLVSAKVVRASMVDLEDLIRRVPDLRIIFLMRDPRAIASSRVQKDTALMYTKQDSIVSEAKGLCIRMQDDIVAKKEFELRYPGAILTVRYEDFVTEPRRIVDKVFDFVGRPPPENIDKFLSHWMRGSKDSGMFGIQRVSAEKGVDKWRSNSTPGETHDMSTRCLTVLKEFNYKL